jgi:hypothetical protein
MIVTKEQALRWSRVQKVRELINNVLRELNSEPDTMTRESERAVMWLAIEVAGAASDAVSEENRAALGRLYDELHADFEAAGDLLTLGTGDPK